MVTQVGKKQVRDLAAGKPPRNAPAISAAPAGGTGATAGAYDSAVNRDAMIATLNGVVAALKAVGIIR